MPDGSKHGGFAASQDPPSREKYSCVTGDIWQPSEGSENRWRVKKKKFKFGCIVVPFPPPPRTFALRTLIPLRCRAEAVRAAVLLGKNSTKHNETRPLGSVSVVNGAIVVFPTNTTTAVVSQ